MTNYNEIRCDEGIVRTRTREHCVYCHRNVPMGSGVPAVDRDDLWRGMAKYHRADCEWIATRAHRIEPARS